MEAEAEVVVERGAIGSNCHDFTFSPVIGVEDSAPPLKNVLGRPLSVLVVVVTGEFTTGF